MSARLLAVLAAPLATLALAGSASATGSPPQPPVVTAPTPRCPPGLFPYGGKDGDESEPYHNQECCPDANGNQVCDDKEAVPSATPAPRVSFMHYRAWFR